MGSFRVKLMTGDACYHELFAYDPRKGTLVWKPRPILDGANVAAVKCWNTRYAGKAVGTLHTKGYLRVSIRKQFHYVHRVVWEMHNGAVPEGLVIDHINHDKLDNRIENLRLASHRANSLNMTLKATNTSGVCGVCWNKHNRNWVASISVHGKTIHLGCFASKGEAAAARAKANVKYGFHKNHGLAQVEPA